MVSGNVRSADNKFGTFMKLFAYPEDTLITKLPRGISSYIARPAQGNRPAQPLCDHLRNVAKLADRFAEPLSLVEEAKYAGMLHDLGKYRSAFQDYLVGRHSKDADTWHSIDGAKVAVQGQALLQAFAIAGHQSGLHDLADLQKRLYNDQSSVMPDLITRILHEKHEIKLEGHLGTAVVLVEIKNAQTTRRSPRWLRKIMPANGIKINRKRQREWPPNEVSV